MTRALLSSLLVVLLGACHSVNAPQADGRYPVRLSAVNHLVVNPLGSSSVAARVVSPNEIHVVRDHATNERLIAHELAHIVQWNEVGADYLVVYWAQVLAHGYERAPFEVEAREAESLTWYREWARQVIAAAQ